MSILFFPHTLETVYKRTKRKKKMEGLALQKLLNFTDTGMKTASIKNGENVQRFKKKRIKMENKRVKRMHIYFMY